MMAKLNFQQSLLQSSVSHDSSEKTNFVFVTYTVIQSITSSEKKLMFLMTTLQDLYPYSVLQRLKVKITVSVQLQRAINDTRRWIRVLSRETIAHLKKFNKCTCFIKTNARLFCDVHSCHHVIRNYAEKATLDVGRSTESVFTSWMCKY